MSTRPLRREERDLKRICEAVEQLQQGRSNAHGSFSIDNDGVATSVIVTAPTCGAASHVAFTPTNSGGGNLWPVWIVAANGSFTFFHPAETDACTFTFAING
jgi:hypothetical protein